MIFISRVKNIWKRIEKNISIRLKNIGHNVDNENQKIVILNTALESDNLGDEIIEYYYSNAIKDVVNTKEVYNVATHRMPSERDVENLLNARYVIILGTNILSPQMELYSGWKFDDRLIKMRNVILLGAGWWGYKKPSCYSKYVYRNILSKSIIHSVRDEQTEKMLKYIGVKNVVNTNCLTMLGLEKKCANVPRLKSQSVIFTVTGVMNRTKYDIQMIRILRENYQTLYFWPQGDIDLQYLQSIDSMEKIIVLERTFEAYTRFLKKNDKLDYIGTRLHGGIHALQNMHRTVVVAIDNRAIEISHDTGLPIIKDNKIESDLDRLINSEWNTEIKLNTDSISTWYKSFSNIKV